ncbi:hypothetical protein [Candidatus Poriferisodalis sp.]|uniref:hypothetical protein n=1 Tax=Candidatus Poriferisodalis sp. TaxID=3101277 RepID=UPI003B019921
MRRRHQGDAPLPPRREQAAHAHRRRATADFGGLAADPAAVLEAAIAATDAAMPRDARGDRAAALELAADHAVEAFETRHVIVDSLPADICAAARHGMRAALLVWFTDAAEAA